MYGMVNKAAQRMLESRFGDDTWAQVKRKAQLEVDGFISMKQYPDDVTYRIVAAAAKVLDVPADEVLVEFGEFWIEYALVSGYRDLLKSTGRDLFEFLENLDGLHTRLSQSFPEYRPPSFELKRRDADHGELIYTSDREGLAPFVVGLITGAGRELFDAVVEVDHISPKSETQDYDVFRVRIVSRV